MRNTILISTFILFVIASPANAQYGGGSGTAEDPYQIWTPAQMNTIGANQSDWGKKFKLMADIDLSAYTGTSFNIIGNRTTSFTGVFDGNGRTISNFKYDASGLSWPDNNFIGLFGDVNDPNAEIKDLGLINPNVDAGTGR